MGPLCATSAHGDHNVSLLQKGDDLNSVLKTEDYLEANEWGGRYPGQQRWKAQGPQNAMPVERKPRQDRVSLFQKRRVLQKKRCR